MTHNTQWSKKRTRGDPLFVDGALPAGTEASLETLSQKRRQITLHCHTGRRIEGEWIGVPVATLIEEVAISERATHILVESVDGFRACFPLLEALDSLVAFEETRLDCDDSFDVTPRIVSPFLDSRRAVKFVDRITAIRLEPDEDATAYENLPE